MALQYAQRMGFNVVAIGRGRDVGDDARQLGANAYVDTHQEDAVGALRTMGGAKAIIATITDAKAVSAIMPGLAPGGRLVVLGVAREPLTIQAGGLVGGEQSLLGSMTGTPYENERTLAFSVLTNARPWVETRPLEQAAEALEKVRSGDARFGMVLTMKGA